MISISNIFLRFLIIISLTVSILSIFASDIFTEEQKYLFDIMKNRRTVRSYRSNPVPEEHIIRIIDAARYCPTAGNQQPWKFLIIRDIEKLGELKVEALKWFMKSYRRKYNPEEERFNSVKEMVKSSLQGVLSAPVYIAVLVDNKVDYPEYVLHDGVLAAGYLMIAARSLGYGTGFFTSYFPEDKMKSFFNIPERYKLICFTPVGIPEEWPEMPEKKDINQFVVFEEF